MNSMQDNGAHDRSLKDDLEKLSQAYQQLETENPPELLDQAVLNRAHRAVEAQARWLDFGWIHGLTTAAVIVLALSIILTQSRPPQFEENGMLPADPSRKDVGRAKPALIAAKALAGAKARPAADREARDKLPATKAARLEHALLEEDMVQAKAPAEVSVSKQAVVTLAVESPEIGSGPAKIDAVKTDADQIAAERSQLPAAEAQLQTILMLKHAGNDHWKAELKLFIESYPDYPLPDELEN